MATDPRDNRPLTTRANRVLTVGQDEGDLRGNDDQVLQAGADYLHRLGGGVLKVLPGTYTMRNALFLHPNLTVCGAGSDTVLKKAAGVNTPVIRDSDWYEARVRVEDPGGFSPGCGVMLRSYKGEGSAGMTVVKDTVTAVNGNELSLTRRMEKNMWLSERATAATVFPLLTAEWVNDVRVENLVLDGNRTGNEEINGNYAGAVFLLHCDRFTFRDVTARNYNGDGFSFQVCDDVHFEACRSEDNANLGFHPGSGSQRPVFNTCVSVRNNQGIFFCWGVSDGLAEGCVCSENRDFGISIGHRDTDNRIVGCTIERNEKVGVLLRKPVSAFRGAHRNLIEGSVIRDNGFKAEGVGVDIVGFTCDVALRNNRIEDTGAGLQKIGVRVSAEADGTVMDGNRFTGLATDVMHLEAGE